MFQPVTEETVFKILQSLNSNKATGLDKVPPRFSKYGAKFIKLLSHYMFNISMSQGKIPSELKSAKITPLYKKQNEAEAGNNRHISILSAVCKLFEKVVYDQLNKYLTDHQLLYEYQSGFRSSYSTDTCLIHLTDYIKSDQDKGNLIGIVILDLQKAFDTVYHNILLGKLQFQESALKWFKAYLENRQQSVDIGGIRSAPTMVTCGVPQGFMNLL